MHKIIAYGEKIKMNYSWKIAFFSTMILGLITHMYKFTNTLLNHDSPFNFYSSQNMVETGRWFLSVACGFSSYYDLPWLNGILSLLYIAITSVIVIDLFKIEKKLSIILVSGILVASPVVVETFFYNFTADGYFLAMLLSALSAYIFVNAKEKIYMYAFSGILLCLTCGIYQAYVSFFAVLLISYFIINTFNEEKKAKEYLKFIITFFCTLLCALISYYVIWKLVLAITGIEVTDYQGVSEVGKIDVTILFTGTIRSLKSLYLYMCEWDIFEHECTTYALLNILFVLFSVIVMIFTFIKSKVYKSKIRLLFIIIAIIAIAPVICMWNYTSNSVNYRAMMFASLSLVYILIIKLTEQWISGYLKLFVNFLLCLILFNYILMANISYTFMEKINKSSYAMGMEIMSRVHILETENEIKGMTIIGNRNVQVYMGGEDSDISERKLHMLVSMLERDLCFNESQTYAYLTNTFDLDIPLLDEVEKEELSNNENVKAMKSWPASNSVCVIDGVLVIKY